MWAAILLSSSMLTVALAAPSNEIRKRDLLTIQGAFVSVSAAASNLDVAIRALTPDPNTAAALGPAIMDVEFALTQARTDVAPTQPVSISEGIVLQNAADTLAKSVKIMVMSSLLQRQTLDQLNMTPVLLKSFMNQNMLSAALSQVVLAKLPAEGIASAMSAFAGAGGSVGMGIVSFSNPPLAMPPGMAPPPMSPPQPGAPPAAMGQNQTPTAPQGMPASAAATATTNATVTQILGGKVKSKRLL